MTVRERFFALPGLSPDSVGAVKVGLAIASMGFHPTLHNGGIL
jgi:hypothetical protein